MDKEFIIAIELGSSKMTGIAGKKNLDGSITILAVAKEDSTICIRKGVAYNIDKTTVALTNLVKKLKNALKTDIAQVYVGVSGQSIRSVKNTIVKELPDDTIITQNMVDSIMDANRAMTYPDQEILEAATQEYKVDSIYQPDPVGIECKRLEGNFLNILWRKQFYRKLKQCFENAHIKVAEMYLAPIALADHVLTEVERRSGCVLVDLGADTTTVAVYTRNVLRHLVVIPLGSNNITKDIMSLDIDRDKAEALKLRYADAFVEGDATDEKQAINIGGDQSIDRNTLADIIEARTQEIIENAWMQVPSEYVDKLLCGIVLTGGGSNMKNIEKAFQQATNIQKIRTAKFVNITINTAYPDLLPHNGTMNAVLSVLAKGNENCAGGDLANDLFGSNYEATRSNAKAEEEKKAAEEAQRKAEEERRKKEEAERQAEEEARRQAEEEARRQAEEEARRNNSIAHKLLKSLKRFGSTIMAADENEDTK